MRIVLASASPRRKELLAQIGYQFEVRVSDAKEQITSDIPHCVVEELSLQKAQAVADVLCATITEEASEEELLVIGADTIVASGGRILGKPKSETDAVNMLSMLQGNTHEVFTGVTLILMKEAGERVVKTFYEQTKVMFYPMSDAEIAEYVATKDPMDKAGAYGIQGFCARYIKKIDGDYNNVVGLPIGRLYQEISQLQN